MKKSKVMIFALACSMSLGNVKNINAGTPNMGLLEMLDGNDSLNEGILTINDNEFISKYNVLKRNSKSKLQKCLKKGNIIALYHKQKKDCSMAEVLEFPIDVSDESCLGKNESYCTLYYLDENGVPTIHDIDVEQKEKKKNVDDVVQRVERDVLKKNRKSFAKTLSTNYTTKYIGKYERTYRNSDVALLELTYKCYTLQNYDRQDFYTILGSIYANPGRAMYDAGETSFDRDIQGDGLDVGIAASSPNTKRVEYGPVRTIGSHSYSVSLGGSWDKGGVSVSPSFSYSKNIDDTSISVNSLPNNTIWKVSLSRDAQKQTCSFFPGITYSTSSKSEHAYFYVDTTFRTDAWNELPTSTHIDKSICCYPSKIGL